MKLNLDIRTKFIAMLMVSTASIGGKMPAVFPEVYYPMAVIPFILLLTEGRYLAFLKGILTIVTALLLQEFLSGRIGGIGESLILMMSYTALRMLPGVMMGYYLIASTTMSDMAESLRRARFPDAIIIPLSVVFRFLYSTRQDYRMVRESMKMRGLGISVLFRSPMRFLEYRLVPLMMCASKTSDDVAVSAMTRGMIPGQPRSSISTARLRIRDAAALGITAVFGTFWLISCFV